jgi:hypothetical protein
MEARLFKMRMLGDYYNIKNHILTMFIEEVLPDKMNGRIIMIPKELDPSTCLPIFIELYNESLDFEKKRYCKTNERSSLLQAFVKSF